MIFSEQKMETRVFLGQLTDDDEFLNKHPASIYSCLLFELGPVESKKLTSFVEEQLRQQDSQEYQEILQTMIEINKYLQHLLTTNKHWEYIEFQDYRSRLLIDVATIFTPPFDWWSHMLSKHKNLLINYGAYIVSKTSFQEL